MAGISSSERFISEITQQQIFQTFLESLSVDNDSKILSQNKLVCRNNFDLFFANENLVRCCTINSDYTNYRLLDNKYGDFKIRSLEMNSLGSLLAIVGDKDLVVVSLPTSLTASNASLLPTNSYKIHGIEGQIKKVIWQSIIANDCCLVVLNDNSEVKSYDLSFSSHHPQLSIDLKKEELFKDEEVSSIAFGSKANLSGSLTLYVSSCTSKIFAIYPFIHRLGKISTTEPNVSELLEESASIINAVQEKFPSENMALSCNQSALNRASFKQYSYILSLYKQFENSLSPRKEYRQLLSQNPVEYSILTQELPEDFCPALQGPIANLTDKMLKDLICINSNDSVSFLVSASTSNLNESYLHYHSQLKPLIMKWTDTDKELTTEVEFSLETEVVQENFETQLKTGYIKPRKGFGFIDVAELSSDIEETIPSLKSEGNEAKSQESELHFWRNNFSELSTLAIDQIPINASKSIHLSILDSEELNVALKVDNALIYFNCATWCEEIVIDILNGKKPGLDIANDYKVAVEGNQEVSSFALVRDTINETGEFLIILKNSKDKNLEVKQVSEKTAPAMKDKAINDSPIEKVNHESVLTKEPFDELLSQLETLKRVNRSNLENALSMKKELTRVPIYSSNTEILKNLNQLSSETIQQVSKFTSFAIHLNLRVITEVEELKSQIESIEKISSIGLDKDILDSKNKKANELISRQDKINERIEKLQEKISNSIQRIKFSKSLPLSDAEKLWFKEINSINAQISQDTNDNKSLNSILEGMTSQVSKIVKNIKEGREDDQNAEDKLKDLQAHQNISKLKQWLQEENDLILLAKNKLEESFKQLKI